MTDEATTDATTSTTDPRLDIEDVAHQAVTDPTKLAPAQITRLGDYILDHSAHVIAHNRLVGMTSATGATRDILAERRAARQSQLLTRLEPSAPGATGPAIEQLPDQANQETTS